MLDLEWDFFPVRTSKPTQRINETFCVMITHAPPVCGMARVKVFESIIKENCHYIVLSQCTEDMQRGQVGGGQVMCEDGS